MANVRPLRETNWGLNCGKTAQSKRGKLITADFKKENGGKVGTPNAGGEAFMWEGFGSVTNNNITASIKPLCQGEDHCFNLLCWTKRTKINK